MRTLTLAGCGPLFRSRDPRTVLREEQRTMRTRVFVVPLFAANLPRRFDLQRLLSLLFPSSLFFSFPFPSRCDLFLPKNALPTVISVINGRPLTTRFILDHRFVSRPGTDRLRGDKCGILFQVKGPTAILCPDTVSPHDRKTTRSSTC